MKCDSITFAQINIALIAGQNRTEHRTSIFIFIVILWIYIFRLDPLLMIYLDVGFLLIQ